MPWANKWRLNGSGFYMIIKNILKFFVEFNVCSSFWWVMPFARTTNNGRDLPCPIGDHPVCYNYWRREYKCKHPANVKSIICTLHNLVNANCKHFPINSWRSVSSYAPRKQKKVVKQPVPFMNTKLRKACLHKTMLRNKYFKHVRASQWWELYRKSRNHVTKLKAVSMNTYFYEKCNSDSFRNNPRQYWRTIKPYMSNKCKTSDQDISLFHENKLINDPVKVCKIFNEYFIKATSNSGNEEPIGDDETIDDILCTYKDCEVIQRITSNVPHDGIFNFSASTVKEVNELLHKTDPRKATGYDDIPPKLLKMGATVLAATITNLINQSIEKSHFPTALKKSELSPLFKNKDSLITENYRPLSILSSVSKIFEKVFNQQLYDHFQDIMSGLLSAFRKKYGCQHVLTRLIEDCKQALDKHVHVGLLLLDLSKAFDCLPHTLLLCKLHAYGVSRDACDLLCSCLTNHSQRVKISSVKNDWAKLIEGVQQDSVLGPMLFNVLVNDLT